ncbi:centromere protein H [Arvicanthis niloticus]|uniref:centromere protein H n=1 Tax=Arvicanthis niloticus TaxID=61156 RepID=UPI0014867F1A|nr:centromere protein H [Arvicanthis niloticus]
MEQRQERPVAGAEACGEERGLSQAAEERIEDRISLLLRLRAQTKQQLLEYKSMIDANEEKTPEQIIQEKQIEFKIENLENEIEDVKSNFEVKSLALSRMKLSAALQNDMENSGPESSVLTDDMKHILKLQKLIMKSQEESSELEKKLLDVRKKRLQLKQASRTKLLEVQTEKNKQKEDVDKMENSEMIKTLKKNLQMEIKITTVIQHAFQGLILGSKTNWAEDPALRETVLQLEKSLTTL